MKPDWEERLDKKTAGLNPDNPEDRRAIIQAHMELIHERAMEKPKKQWLKVTFLVAALVVVLVIWFVFHKV